MNNLIAIVCFCFFGALPIFWNQLHSIPIQFTMFHRSFWATVLLTSLILAQGRFCQQLESLRKFTKLLVLSTVLNLIRWLAFVWAVTQGHVLDASLAYFIAPLITILFGAVFLQEKMKRAQWIAVIIMSGGLCYQVFITGIVPFLSLIIACASAGYGVLGKFMSVRGIERLNIDAIGALAVFSAYLSYSGLWGAAWSFDSKSMFLLFLTGVFTVAPLWLYITAMSRLPVSRVGCFQFIEPAISLLVGVWILGEEFTSEKMITFGCIWIGIFVYLISVFSFSRHSSEKQI